MTGKGFDIAIIGGGMGGSAAAGAGGDGVARAARVRFVGFSTWDQDCTRQTHADMDAAMHAACAAAHGGSARAATYAEVLDRLVDDLPLFSAALRRVPASPPRSDALASALAAINPDDLTPRDALEALYRLKGIAATDP